MAPKTCLAHPPLVVSVVKYRDSPARSTSTFRRGQKSAGSIRVSLGLVTNFSDVWHFLGFIAGFRDQTPLTIGALTFEDDSCRVIRDGS